MREHQTKVKVGGQFYQQDENNLFHCHVASCDFTCKTVPQLRNHAHVRAGWNQAHNPSTSVTAAETMVVHQPAPGKQASYCYIFLQLMSLSDVEMAPADPDKDSGSEYVPTTPQQPSSPLLEPDSEAPTLLRPQHLSALNLGVHPQHKLIVCEECQCAVPRNNLSSHFRATHNSASKVTTPVLDELEALDIPEGLIPIPNHPVAPIQSIKVMSGYKCTVPGCSHLTAAQSVASVHKNHFILVHPGLRAQDFTQSCHLQQIYRHPKVYWLVDHLADTFSGCSPNVKQIVLDFQAVDAAGLNTGTIQAPADVRLVRPYLRTFRWLDRLENRDPVALEALVRLPNPRKDTEFPWLRAQLQHYVDNAIEKLQGLNVVALQIINTPKGYVVLFMSKFQMDTHTLS